jgi:hypothetical protein
MCRAAGHRDRTGRESGARPGSDGFFRSNETNLEDFDGGG